MKKWKEEGAKIKKEKGGCKHIKMQKWGCNDIKKKGKYKNKWRRRV